MPQQIPASPARWPEVRILRFELEMLEDGRIGIHTGITVQALLREALAKSRSGANELPAGLLVEAPERCRNSFRKGEPYAFGFRLLCLREGDSAALVADIVEGLHRHGEQGRLAFRSLGGNFRLVNVTDVVARATWQRDQPPRAIPASHFEREIDALSAHANITLDFVSPLRFDRIEAAKNDHHRCLDAEFFSARHFVRNISNRLARIGVQLEQRVNYEDEECTTGAPAPDLVWLDSSYGSGKNPTRDGGVLGTVTLVPESASWFEPLVLGQYVRIGEGLVRGHGAYRIRELGDDPLAVRRSRSLLDLALSGRGIEESASRYDVPVDELLHEARKTCAGGRSIEPPQVIVLRGAGGTQRELAVPSRIDRALQSLVHDRLAPAIDALLEQSSHAYRRGYGRHVSARTIQEMIERRGYRYALKADFKRFFDSVAHDALERRLRAWLGDDDLVAVLMAWVRSGSPETNRGLPTGAPISPLLSNLFLDAFDEELEDRGRMLVRYADDWMILFRKREEAEGILAEAKELAASLELALNEQKTRILDLREPFHFLGFRFERRVRWETTPTGDIKLIEELGWKPAAPPAGSAADAYVLPAEESTSSQSASAIVVAGPGLDTLRLRGDDLLVCYEQGEHEDAIPWRQVRELHLLGPATLNKTVVRKLLDAGIPTTLSSPVTGSTLSFGEQHDITAEALFDQVDAHRNGAVRLDIARQIITAKVHNHRRLAEVLGASATLLQNLTGHADAARSAADLSALLQIEGLAARTWYDAFRTCIPEGFTFERRVKPNANDPVNALLNFTHTMLHRHTILAVRCAGLAPALGLMHQPRAGHAALASDLQEPFRHLMDRAVLRVLRLAKPGDFRRERGRGLRIAPRLRMQLVEIVERDLVRGVSSESRREARPWRDQFHWQARALRSHLANPSTPFTPFRLP